jgi:hypothetical protein
MQGLRRAADRLTTAVPPSVHMESMSSPTADPFALKRPCGNCPFRTDRASFLSEARAQEIADALHADASFHCHKTLELDAEEGDVEITAASKHCAGAMIVLEREDRPNQMMRIAERLGLYDRTALVMDSPVPESLDEWVGLHSTGGLA